MTPPPRPAPRFTLRPHDWPGRADADCRPLLPGGPADLPLVCAGGVEPGASDIPVRTVPASSGHVVLDYTGPGAAEQVLSEARMRAVAQRLDTSTIVVCLPHPDRLLASTAHPVAVATLEALGGAAFDAVARTGGPTLSRRLLLVVDGRIVDLFVPGTLAARRAVGVSTRRPVESAATTEAPPPPRASDGVLGWLRRVTGTG